MKNDISRVLKGWDFNPGQLSVRRFPGDDGREVIQLRLDLGLLQMQATGRPDGKRPKGCESLLEHFTKKLEKHLQQHDDDDSGFVLAQEDCAKLQLEAIQFYHRYICLYQLDDFLGVLRDTQHNLDIFALVDAYTESDDINMSFQQFVPQLLMLRARAHGSLLLQARNHPEAIRVVEEVMEEIREHYRDMQREDLLEHSAELAALSQWVEDLKSQRPKSKREKLQLAMEQAIRDEDYEKAAKFRDELKRIAT